MDSTNTRGQSVTTRIHYAEFSVGGLLRFLSHRELLNLFARAAGRAGLPLAFSQGHNPRPKVALPLPRSVGMRCLDDLLRIELHGPADMLCPHLQDQLPRDITIHRAWPTDSRRFPQPQAVEWTVDLPDADDLAERIQTFLDKKRCTVTRTCNKTGKQTTIDLRALVHELKPTRTGLWAKLAAGPQGSVRPDELLIALAYPPPEGLLNLTRTKIHWQDLN